MNQTGVGPAGILEFKGRMMTLSVLRLLTDELSAVEAELKRRLARTPDFFQRMPLLLEPAGEDTDVEGLAKLLRGLGLMPVALYQPGPAQAEAAQRAGLGVISDARGAPREQGDRPRNQNTRRVSRSSRPDNSTSERPAAKILTSPVRSGQQVYARETDLIVMNTVSPGAEVIADGCIHVYGPLRGRALAGAQGDVNARIFCQSLEAELLAVAGQYRVAEDMDDTVRNTGVQIYMDGEALKIEPLSQPKIHPE